MSTSEANRANIELLFEVGLSERRISTRLKLPKTTVHDIIQRIKMTGSTKAKKTTGRPRITSKRTDNTIKHYAVINPTASSGEIQAQLPQEVNVSARTIRRRLPDARLKSYRPAIKPRLSPKNINDRLIFCRAHADLTVEQWGKVLFSETQPNNLGPPPHTFS